MRYERRMRPRPHRFALTAALAAGLLFAAPAFAAGTGDGELLPVLEALVLMLVLGKLGGALFAWLRQAPVLGELLAGIALGNVGLLGWHGLDAVRTLPGLDLLAQIGVLFLLFTIGVRSDVTRMAAVGRSALLVAVLGVVAPMVLGWFTAHWFLPDRPEIVCWFVGATLCATSVGITARVLGDLGRTDSAEGRIILGAAVIDDVLGLIVLAVVAGSIRAAGSGTPFHATALLAIVAKAVGFLAVALVAGRWLSRHAFRVASRLPGEGLLLPLSIALCFALALLAARMGLAPIVGAFAAGLVVDDAHVETLRARDRHRRSLDELLEPLAGFLVPVFFVLMGMRVDLGAFGRAGVLPFAAALTVAAIAGKQVCGLGVLERGADRLAVGLGMIPRGEVGLIFAGIGATLMLGGAPVVDGSIFSAIVVMVVLTTLATPPLLTWRLARPRAAASEAGR